MKKYQKNNTWERLPIPDEDYRPRFFIEIYQELLNSNTLASYQPRLMNLLSYIDEIIDLIKFYNQDERAKHYIIKSLSEFIHYLKDDKSANEIYHDEISMLENEFKYINVLNDINIKKIRIIMGYFLSDDKKTKYWDSICNNLLESVCSEEFNKEHIRRNLDKINSSCKFFISYLLNQGMSTRYLFNRSDMFTQISNYGSRNWKEQMSNIIKKLSIKEYTHRVYFILSTDKKLTHDNYNINNLNIYNHNDFIKENKQIIKRNERFTKFLKQKKGKGFHYVVEFKIKSSNYDNAQLKAKNRLDVLLDAINVLYKIEILDNSLVITENQGKQHFNTIQNISLERGSRFLYDHEMDLISIFNRLNRDSIEIIENSLRYYRLARESKSIEQKILNTWISIESLYVRNRNNKENIISNIIQNVPMIYNSFSIIRRVRYAKELLKSNKISIPDEIKNHLDIKNNMFDKTTTDEQVLKIITHKELFLSLVNNINGSEHLKYRLGSIMEFIHHDKIMSKFKESEESIHNQLYRIYFMRNKISHRGHYKKINPHLLEHLTDYLILSYAALVIGSSYIHEGSLEDISISDLLSSYTLQFNKINRKISDGNLDINSIYVKKFI